MSDHLFSEDAIIDLTPHYRRSPVFSGPCATSFYDRLSAKGIDLLVAVIIWLIIHNFFPIPALIVSSLFLVFKDGVGDGQSIGKKIMGIRVIEDQTGMACTLFASLQRNFFLGLLGPCLISVWTWPLVLLGIAPLAGLEVYLLFQLESGVRLGDVLGNTVVVDAIEEPVADIFP